MNRQLEQQLEEELLQNRPAPWALAQASTTIGLAVLTCVSIAMLIADVSTLVAVPVVLLTAAAVLWASHRLDLHRFRGTADVFRMSIAKTVGAEQELQRLRDSVHQALLALTKMRDGVVMLSGNGEILVINPSALRLLSLSTSIDPKGRVLREVVRVPELIKAVDAALRNETPQKLALEIVEGTVVRPLKIRVDRIGGEKDSNFLMTVRDETEALQAESIRREFVADLSHEIKTPLAAIKGYAETVELAIEDDPSAALYFMTQIRTQCVRMERLVADMMQLARAQAGRDKLKRRRVTLGTIVDQAIHAYAPTAESKQISITAESELHQAEVFADTDSLLTIVNNLIGNAVHYTPDGGKVNIGCHRDGERWSLRVIDTGVGISASEQTRVFERFYRGEKTRDSATGGTGIGLSIVKNLTESLGGDVCLTSAPGKGSTFEIRLPVFQPDLDFENARDRRKAGSS